jgi:hypothetical protein
VQDLFDAAMQPRSAVATRTLRELFGRLDPPVRQALWLACTELGSAFEYPWFSSGEDGKRATPVADLMEALDLFPEHTDEESAN